MNGGPHHQMIEKIVLHLFYVYPLLSWSLAGSSFLGSCESVSLLVIAFYHSGDVPVYGENNGRVLFRAAEGR